MPPTTVEMEEDIQGFYNELQEVLDATSVTLLKSDWNTKSDKMKDSNQSKNLIW